jgi:N-methylhydantoinase A
MDIAAKDIEGEGFSSDRALYYLDLFGDGNLSEVNVRYEKAKIASGEDVKAICDRFGKFDKRGTGKVTVAGMILNALVAMPHYELTASPLAGEDPKGALRGERDVFWSPESGFRKTPIYDRGQLLPGNRVVGPAVVEASDTTYVIPEGKAFSISKYSHGVLEEI